MPAMPFCRKASLPACQFASKPASWQIFIY